MTVGCGAGAFHSQNPEAWFVHVPGLKVVAPGTPADAKGLLAAAIRDPNPVIYFESKPLYRSMRGPVPDHEYIVPIGSAHVAREGEDAAIITYGAQLRESLEAAGRLAEDGIEVTVLDLRTLKPMDEDIILEVTRATGKVLIVHFCQSSARRRSRGCRAHIGTSVRLLGRPGDPIGVARYADSVQPASRGRSSAPIGLDLRCRSLTRSLLSHRRTDADTTIEAGRPAQ